MSSKPYQGAFIVEKTMSRDRVRNLYNGIAWLYDAFTDFEPKHHKRAVALAAIQPGETVLEAACGTGRATMEIAQHIGDKGRFYAIDMTPGMFHRAQQRLAKAKLLDRVDMRLADAAQLPFGDASMDVVYNAYMFDLINADDIPGIVAEFKRVLKPGGRVVLVNMSKNKQGQTLYEWLYEHGLLGFASGGCRPVQMSRFLEQAGFRDIKRSYWSNRSFFFLNWLSGTEIVLARKL